MKSLKYHKYHKFENALACTGNSRTQVTFKICENDRILIDDIGAAGPGEGGGGGEVGPVLQQGVGERASGHQGHQPGGAHTPGESSPCRT